MQQVLNNPGIVMYWLGHARGVGISAVPCTPEILNPLTYACPGLPASPCLQPEPALPLEVPFHGKGG